MNADTNGSSASQETGNQIYRYSVCKPHHCILWEKLKGHQIGLWGKFSILCPKYHCLSSNYLYHLILTETQKVEESTDLTKSTNLQPTGKL